MAALTSDEIAYVEHLNLEALRPLLESLKEKGRIHRIGSCKASNHIHFSARIADATTIKTLIESLDATGYRLTEIKF